MIKKRLEKHDVCDQCYSEGAINLDCGCTHGEYFLVELEFEVCDCCGHVLEDGNPADTEFNQRQFKLLHKRYDEEL